jgi:hypothetical protein
MTTNQKILIALGLGAVAFYVYKMRGQKGQGVVTQPQDNKGQNPPTSIEKPQLGQNPPNLPKPQRGQTYEDVVRMGGGGINPPHLQKMREENFALYEAVKQKYGTERGGNIGDRITTKYGTYEYRRKPTGGALGKGFTTTWVKI